MAFVFGLATIKTMPGYSFIKFALFMVDAFVAFMVPIISLGNPGAAHQKENAQCVSKNASLAEHEGLRRNPEIRWVIPTAESLEYQTHGRD
jgi:hypothetical protein